MAADPKRSAGAREERKSFRGYIRRAINRRPMPTLEDVLAWVLKRQERYDKQSGGLGSK